MSLGFPTFLLMILGAPTETKVKHSTVRSAIDKYMVSYLACLDSENGVAGCGLQKRGSPELNPGAKERGIDSLSAREGDPFSPYGPFRPTALPQYQRRGLDRHVIRSCMYGYNKITSWKVTLIDSSY